MRVALICAIVAVSLLISMGVSDAKDLHPVVIVPALLGSRIEMKFTNVKTPHWYCKTNEDWHLEWLYEDNFLPFVEVCCHLAL